MKKITTAFIILTSLFASPVMADERDYHRERRGGSDWIAPLIGGAIIGAIISGSNHDKKRRRDNEYEDRRYDPYYDDSYTARSRPREYYCVTEQFVDRYGRIYYRRSCQ